MSNYLYVLDTILRDVIEFFNTSIQHLSIQRPRIKLFLYRKNENRMRINLEFGYNGSGYKHR